MVVWLEYAFAENFCLDALLVYLALKCAKGEVRVLHVLFAAAVGAAEAIVFPLLPLPVWCAYLIKILGGILIVLLAVHKGTFKTYLMATSAFFLLTFALGGMLTAAYSFFNVGYAEGNGYVVEQAPVSLVFALSGFFAVACVHLCKDFYRYKKVQSSLVDCSLQAEGHTVYWKGFCDSGNLLTFQGKPVSVVSAAAIFALFGAHPRAVGRMTVNTVHGGRDSPVFECKQLEITAKGKKKSIQGVYLTPGEVPKDYQLILHTALTEDEYENVIGAESVVAKDQMQ